MANLAVVEQFFNILLHDLDLPDHTDLLVWAMDPRNKGRNLSFFAHSVSDLVAFCDKQQTNHLYWAVATRQAQTTKREHWRGTEADCTWLFGVNLDVDVFSKIAHKAGNLPPTIAEGLALIESLIIQPTVIIGSGYGLQAIYLFKELERLIEPQERIIAKEVGRRLHRHASTMTDYHVDATFNLDRVLRIPGTENWKDLSHPVTATLLKIDGPRYNGIETFLDELPEIGGGSPEVGEDIKDKTSGLYLGGSYDGEMFLALMTNEPKFKRTWEKDRRDFKKDDTQSAYDMSVVSLCLQAGWEPQAILALLLYYHKKRNREQKRLSYYVYTIQTGLAWIQGEGLTELEAASRTAATEREQVTAGESAAAAEQDREDPKVLYENISVFLEFPQGYAVKQAVIVDADPPRYKLICERPDGTQRSIKLGPDTAGSMAKLRQEVVAITNHLMTKTAKAAPTWVALFNRLPAVAEKEEESDLLYSSIVRRALEDYSGENAVDLTEAEAGEEIQKARIDCLRNHSPFFDEDYFWFAVSQFLDYVERIESFHVPLMEIAQTLHELGAHQHPKKLVLPRQAGTRRQQRRYWKIPAHKLFSITSAEPAEDVIYLDTERQKRKDKVTG